ncbi:alpha/beta hydrolase [Litchfieldella xinjiangensis]|uniref:alpha/beta hydrolase n=1 Tax=Litchfieldella xinjiangensis TaxID=1166948 RepID=UPI0005B926F0|nr:alpha/beta hydrolase [Halomonas xinjiangensis]
MLYRDFATQEQIDAQYDPMRGRDGAALLSEWQQRSAETRAHLAVHEDIPYGPTLAERLDLFPAAAPDAPLHVFFHGGYWRALSHKEFSFVAEGLVDAGLNVAVVNYALCPAVPFSELVRQCQAALAWLYRHADAWGADPERLTVSGHSAGGHVCAMLAATDWEGVFGLPSTLIKGTLAISGLYDLRPFPYSWLQPKLQLTGREVANYSPLFLSPRVAAPVHLTAGSRESEEFTRQMHAHGEHLRRYDVPVEAESMPGDDHFSILDHYRPEGEFAATLKRLSA